MRRLTVVFGLFAGTVVLSGCFAQLKDAQEQSGKLATALHDRMAHNDLAGIYNGADQQYRDAVNREKSDAIFSSIYRKLGAPLDCKPGGVYFNVSTSGTTIWPSSSIWTGKVPRPISRRPGRPSPGPPPPGCSSGGRISMSRIIR